MGMTLEKLEKKLADIEKQREENNRIISESKEKIDSIMVKAEEAAANGREDEYIQHKKEAEKYETTIYVKNSQNAKLNTLVTREDVVSAWDNYTPSMVKAYERKLSAFKDAQKVFFDCYMDLVRTQNKVYKTREKLYSICGGEELDLSFEFENFAKLGMHEVRYFKQLDMITPAENAEITTVLYTHTQAQSL